MTTNANLTIREYQEDGSYIDREMTTEEIAQNEADAATHAQYLAELEAKKVQRQSLLDRLGMTEEEANLLLS